MRWLLALMIVLCVLVLGGCQASSPVTTSERVQLKQGQSVQCYGLVGIDAEGRAEFRNTDSGDMDCFPRFVALPGQGFETETEGPPRHFAFYSFTVESTDRDRQEATVLVATTKSSRSIAMQEGRLAKNTITVLPVPITGVWQSTEVQPRTVGGKVLYAGYLITFSTSGQMTVEAQRASGGEKVISSDKYRIDGPRIVNPGPPEIAWAWGLKGDQLMLWTREAKITLHRVAASTRPAPSGDAGRAQP